jgi:hypothetical protein
MVILLGASLAASSCSKMPQIYSRVDHKTFHLTHEDLYASGLAFITPSTVTGQEEEKQAVAFTFAEALAEELPDLKIVSLPETLSAINRAGLSEDYLKMFQDYRATGILHRDTLAAVGAVTGTRYIAELKLAGFRQGSIGRLGVFGLRLMETKYADLRVFFQIWDVSDGSIVWEGVQEVNWAEEAMAEKNITLQNVLEYAAKNLGKRLPGNPDETKKASTVVLKDELDPQSR